ncbi:BamA/TamA family outer membrane protein [uncultured Porphyromonas sp.]|uniref:translocation and assembly module lipoprotein TamL n=1 Tax=uncultured Porphyromonas sp. TaxID=159274 RepID=UPI0025DC708B|nr:BamA/TamA family outer membrane protein [uncultured Porphyromonas sp.]
MNRNLYSRPTIAHALLLLLGTILALSSCSVTQHIPEGELLYIGIGKTRIQGDDGSDAADRAISNMEKVLNVPPNDAFFGSARSRFRIPIGLWFYNGFVNDSTWVGKRLYKLFAEEPKLISDVRPDVRAKQSQFILHEHGYFNAVVTDSIARSSSDSLQARVYYKADLGAPYLYDSISYMEPWLLGSGEILSHAELSRIHKGDQFNFSQILQDRNMLVTNLRDRGYYFYAPDLLVYQVDTLLTPGKVYMQVREQSGYPNYTFEPWRIGSVHVLLTEDDRLALTDTMQFKGITLHYREHPRVRPAVFANRVQLRSGELYSQSLEQSTRQSLLGLGAFSYVDMQFVASDTLHNLLDLYITAELDKPWDSSLSAVFTTKSNNFIGPGLNLSLGRRNLFGGGERLSLDLYGSYEWQTNRTRSNQDVSISDINSYEVGSNLNLQAPRILLPWLYDLHLTHDVQTTYTLSASMLNRARYFQITSLGLSASYSVRNEQHQHMITPLRIHYNRLSRQSEIFQKVITDNPILGLSLRSQLIPQMSYQYTFDNIFTGLGSHHLHIDLGISQAGNILNGIYSLTGRNYHETKKILGVPFAQFVKGTAELRYTYGIDRNQSLALRAGVGAIYSFGNMTVAPYSEQFYVGGANSIRAFTVRSIGPGRFVPRNSRYAFMDQTGEFKLELNAEYRFRLVGDLHGAFFLDSGNVWLLRPDENRPGGSLQEITDAKDFFNQLALGSGVGLRYDLNFLVIRFDVGVGLHLPFETSRQGYYNLPKFANSLGYHFAVGYPF